MEKKQKNFTQLMSKTIITLILIIVFLVSCFGIISILYAGLWLHTYNAFTSKELIGEIEVTPLEQDDRGFDRFKVKYTQYKAESALIQTLFPNQNSNSQEVYIQEEYEMFGDTVFIEAHTVKLPDFLTLFNFRAIYKITGIEGDFVNNRSKAKELPSSERSIYDLNGGVDDNWLWIKKNESYLGFLVDTVEISKKGKDIGDQVQTWGIYITEEGITLDTLQE
jgi:hypothetical protein